MIDKTGLDKWYDFTLSFLPEFSNTSTGSVASC